MGICTHPTWNMRITVRVKSFYMQLKSYLLDRFQYIIADMIKSHPRIGLRTCKIEQEDDSQSEIIQTIQ